MKRATNPRLRSIFLVILAVATLVACQGRQEGSSASVEGEALFRQSVLGGSAGCATCHSLEPGVVIIGPSLAGIATLAAERVEGQSAEDYLRQSIVEPDAYLVEGYPAGVMPSKYAEQLSPEEIESLVAYLLTLK